MNNLLKDEQSFCLNDLVGFNEFFDAFNNRYT